MITEIILWIILGSLVGWYGSSLIRSRARDPEIGVNIAIGINGAVTGGWIVSSLERGDSVTLNIYSLLVACAGAVVLVYSFRVLQK